MRLTDGGSTRRAVPELTGCPEGEPTMTSAAALTPATRTAGSTCTASARTCIAERPSATRPTDDWRATLQDLVAGDPVAHVRVRSVIMSLLAQARVWDLEPLWEEICQ